VFNFCYLIKCNNVVLFIIYNVVHVTTIISRLYFLRNNLLLMMVAWQKLKIIS